MNWVAPGGFLVFLAAILGVSLWRGAGFFTGLCHVITGMGAFALVGGAALVGQWLLEWPAAPLVTADVIYPEIVVQVGLVFVFYGALLAGLGIALWQMLRYMR